MGFHNQDGSVRMWLYKDKGGDGVRLNNGNDGGGDWVFNKNGHLYSPQALHAAGATYQEDGNIHGSAWGGHLSNWLNQNCVLNVQLGVRQVNPGFRGRWDTPSGCVITSASGDSDNWIDAQYAPVQIWKAGHWATIAG
ncbi:hypothetical protein [Arsenophonus nasoniae]|uniref:hypothetical protein n=1 Tax=Arsenophonus nasoniae TaxID=638 RepID=UPI0038797B61